MSRIKDNPIVLLPLSFLGMALIIAVLLPGYGILSVLAALIGLVIIMALLHKKNKRLAQRKSGTEISLHFKSRPNKPGSLDDNLIDLDNSNENDIGST